MRQSKRLPSEAVSISGEVQYRLFARGEGAWPVHPISEEGRNDMTVVDPQATTPTP
jgi:hypothetical protein